MTLSGPAAPPSARSVLARDKLMRTAERLYAERGFAGVSVRQISEAAGQRNNSAVQYHFESRDGLIRTILSHHTALVEKHRITMVEALRGQDTVSLEDHYGCLILPNVETYIEAGTPAWCARFFAQALVEPALRDYVVREHLDTPSLGLLGEIGAIRRDDIRPDLLARHGTMVRQLSVHAFAELEYDLANGRVDPARAEESWHTLGRDLITALCGLTTALLGPL
ncbi:TetR/AcrR family transcriptional regulator [Streptomyces botrytidirepellens]|uniref:TetR/AcrR family transcriptional regulator n=1 Tax=Streptomyces botrytidirepellens TaxID=2486417 RepID=A0A3M8W9E7_9ACTN|nr:TetR/AcrR family transcriptional regulator [Streptomyces botrytidirepellens]RNG25125.1 TetR/AcrR family transcriptional regulator [Streptomyces botrytidirepellens]